MWLWQIIQQYDAEFRAPKVRNYKRWPGWLHLSPGQLISTVTQGAVRVRFRKRELPIQAKPDARR